MDIDGLMKYDGIEDIESEEEEEEEYYQDLRGVKLYRLKCDRGREEETVIDISQKFAVESALNAAA